MAAQDKIQVYEPIPLAPPSPRGELVRAYSPDTAENELDLRAHWRILLKRRWTVIFILLAFDTQAFQSWWNGAPSPAPAKAAEGQADA